MISQAQGKSGIVLGWSLHSNDLVCQLRTPYPPQSIDKVPMHILGTALFVNFPSILMRLDLETELWLANSLIRISGEEPICGVAPVSMVAVLSREYRDSNRGALLFVDLGRRAMIAQQVNWEGKGAHVALLENGVVLHRHEQMMLSVCALS